LPEIGFATKNQKEETYSVALKYGKIGPLTADRLDFHTKGKIPYESLTDKPMPAKAKRRKKREDF
jgi:hypothetical protein